jgi:hypothetical protein
MTGSSAPNSPTALRRTCPAARRPTGPLLLAALLLTSACGSTVQDGDGLAAVATRAAVEQRPANTAGHAHPGSTTLVSPAGATAPAAPPAPAAPGAPAVEDPVVALRSDLQRLLGEHVLLADEVVRGVLLGKDDLATASSASVGRNTDEIVELIGSLAGPATGEQFRTAWDRHVEVLGQYATALEAQDEAGQQAARSAYVTAEQELATAFSAATGGKVPQADLTAAATAHGEHLLGQADAYAAEDYAKAYTLQREAFAHMNVVGDVLARGVAAAQGLPTTELDTPRRDLNSALNRLLAEHMGLMVQALRSAHDESPDFAAAGQALNGNTADLGAAIATLFGPEASQQFLALWASHIEGLVKVAGGTDDPAAQAAGREAQTEYAPQLARFLAGATEQRLPAIDLAAALTVHDDHLLAMADAYAEEDYAESQQQADAGYAHMLQLASTLAVAIGDTKAAQLPQGGAATGGGGTADRDR